MPNHHPDNERMKRRYFDYMKEANGYSEASIDGIAAAISRFESYTRWRDFRAFHFEQAKGFKSFLAKAENGPSGDGLSKATLHATLRALRAFFRWLAGQPGYRSRLTYADADYFNLTDNDTRIATARRDAPVPTMEQIGAVLDVMPANTPIEKRNRALIAFALLSGARDGALASLRLKHVDLSEGKVVQDARQVKTKRRKTFTTWFFPVGEGPLRIVQEWVAYLRGDLLWGGDDPLFPKTRVVVGNRHTFEAVGLAREFWTTAGPIRAIFREAFAGAGLPYFHPHTFRKTLAQLAERVCPDAESLKAWSQNLGHEDVLTTLRSYGTVPATRQADLMKNLSRGVSRTTLDRFAQEVAQLAKLRLGQ